MTDWKSLAVLSDLNWPIDTRVGAVDLWSCFYHFASVIIIKIICKHRIMENFNDKI